jgi:hypothetical protein
MAWSTALPVVFSAALAVVALVDQVGGQSLAEHATALYEPHGKELAPGLLYGLLYTVAVVGAVLWLLVARRRAALAIAVITINAGLALLLLTATEYGGQIFPPMWGALALLPPVAGVVALLRR